MREYLIPLGDDEIPAKVDTKTGEIILPFKDNEEFDKYYDSNFDNYE